MKARTKLLWITLFLGTCTAQAQDLRLENRMVIDGIVLFENLNKPGQFYYVPDTGTIATDENGEYQISFDKYVSDERDGPAGAIIQVLLDFFLPEVKLLELEDKLRLKKPGAGIVGAVPISSLPDEPFFIPVPEERNIISFQFFPPASALVTIDVSKNNAQLLQTQMQTNGFYLPLTCTYEIQFGGYAEIQADTLKMLLQVDSDSAKSTITKRWLRQKMLRLFSDKGEEITLLEWEIAPVANYFTKNLGNLPATFLLAGNDEDFVFDSISIISRNRICKVWASKASLIFPAAYLNLKKQREEIKSGAYNLYASKFSIREVNVILDLDLEEIIDKVKSYHVDFKMTTGTLEHRYIYTVDSLVEKAIWAGPRQKVQYPMSKSLSKKMKYQDKYSCYIKHNATIDKFNSVVNESKWDDRARWMAITVASAFKPISMRVEGDLDEMRVNGFKGARVEFFEAKKKDNKKKSIRTTSDSTFQNPSNSLSIKNEKEDEYEIGQYLGDILFMVSERTGFVEKNIFSPRKDEYVFYHKITWFLNPSVTNPHGLSKIIETSPELKINTDYLYLILPKLKN